MGRRVGPVLGSGLYCAHLVAAQLGLVTVLVVVMMALVVGVCQVDFGATYVCRQRLAEGLVAVVMLWWRLGCWARSCCCLLLPWWACVVAKVVGSRSAAPRARSWQWRGGLRVCRVGVVV